MQLRKNFIHIRAFQIAMYVLRILACLGVLSPKFQLHHLRFFRFLLTLVIDSLLGGMPVKFIGNYFVTFVYRYQVLRFTGNYAVCELPIKSIGKCFITDI